METLRWAVSFVCTPFFYVLDWLTYDDEYDRLIAEQHERNIQRSFDND